MLVGWLLGALLLCLYLTFVTHLERWLAAQPLTQQIVIPATVVLLLILLFHAEDALKTMSSLFGLTIAVPLERLWVRFKVGIWVGLGAPWLFVRSGLTEQEAIGV